MNYNYKMRIKYIFYLLIINRNSNKVYIVISKAMKRKKML